MTRLTTSPRVQVLALTCACAGTTAFLYAVDPNRTSVYPTCLLYQRTGFYCAGCGATRATFALLHGRFLEALHDNALYVLILPFLAWKMVSYLLRTWREKAWPEISYPSALLWRWGIFSLGTLLVFAALRNIPEAPFSWLAPIPPTLHIPGIRA